MKIKWMLGACALVGVACAAAAALLEFGAFDLPLEQIEARYRAPQSQFAEIDGVRLHYIDEGQGPAVVLVHGSMMNLRVWDSLAASLRSSHRVVRFDMLMAGLTGPAQTGSYSIERNMRLLDELANRLQLKTFALLGTSSGGIVAFRYASAYPGRVERLILVNAAGLPRTPITDPNRARGSSLDRWITSRYRSRSYWERSLRDQFTSGIEPAAQTVAMVYDMNRRAGLRVESAKFMQNFSTGDPERVLGTITAPTLILWGIDNITVDHLQADVFEHWLVAARTAKKKYPKVGHYLYLEIPDDFNRDVAQFVSGHLDTELKANLRR